MVYCYFIVYLLKFMKSDGPTLPLPSKVLLSLDSINLGCYILP